MTGGGEGLDDLNADGILSFWNGHGDNLESRMGDVSVVWMENAGLSCRIGHRPGTPGLFIYSLTNYFVLGTVLGAQEIASEQNTQKFLPLWCFCSNIAVRQ